MAASSTTGVGQGSADKAGQRGSEHLFVGVEKLVGTRIVLANTITMTGSTNTVTFPQTLNGAAADYIVLATGAHLCFASSVTTTNFVMNGTAADVISYAVIRKTGATVTVN